MIPELFIHLGQDLLGVGFGFPGASGVVHPGNASYQRDLQ